MQCKTNIRANSKQSSPACVVSSISQSTKHVLFSFVLLTNIVYPILYRLYVTWAFQFQYSWRIHLQYPLNPHTMWNNPHIVNFILSKLALRDFEQTHSPSLSLSYARIECVRINMCHKPLRPPTKHSVVATPPPPLYISALVDASATAATAFHTRKPHAIRPSRKWIKRNWTRVHTHIYSFRVCKCVVWLVCAWSILETLRR